MTNLDLLIVGIVVLCGALGVISGLVWQIAGILSLAVGAAAAILLGPMVAETFGRWTDNRSLATAAAYLSLFSLASVAVRLLATVFSHLLEKFKLKKLDRLLGAAVGAAKGLAICAVVALVLGRHGSADMRRMVEESMLGGRVIALADLVLGKAEEAGLPAKAREAGEKLKDAAEKLRDKGLHWKGESGKTAAPGPEKALPAEVPPAGAEPR